MKKLYRRVLVATVLLASASGFAAPSPMMDGGPMREWDLGHEPAIKGGAKSIEQVTISNGTPSKSKYVISLNAEGEYARTELVTEGSSKIYVSEYKRNADGTLDEVIQISKTAGQPDKVYSRQKATYANGKLVSIACERCLTKPELQHEGTTTIETAADGFSKISMKDDKGEVRLSMTMTRDKDGRMAKATMVMGQLSGSTAVTRNAAGLVESAINEERGVPGNTAIKYEMDEKGNWTKATVTTAVKTPDGKERTMTSEIVRKITY